MIDCGIIDQDSDLLASLAWDEGLYFIGAYRRATSPITDAITNSASGCNGTRIDFDRTYLGSCLPLLTSTRPAEAYNLAAQSFAGTSFKQPATIAKIIGMGALKLLDALHLSGMKSRFYRASTSEVCSKVWVVPLTE
ncbi:MAG: GDP-mannose 4,6-dehydratase [Sphingomonas sp.]|nr:GDP-mannose 4,6-dehydratase [Sphingomonas sp.]